MRYKRLRALLVTATLVLSTPALANYTYTINNSAGVAKQISFNGITESIDPYTTVTVRSETPLNIPNMLQLTAASPDITNISGGSTDGLNVVATVLPPGAATASNQTAAVNALSTLVNRSPALDGAGRMLVSDAGNAPISGVVPNSAGASPYYYYPTGTTVPAGRSVYLVCPGAGTVSMQLASGGTVDYPLVTGAVVLPFAVVQVVADTANCSHQNIQ